MHTPGPLAHWVSLVHAVHLLAALQIGVEPEQSALLAQPTHWPMMVAFVVLAAVAHTGVAPVQGPVPAVPPSLDPPSD